MKGLVVWKTLRTFANNITLILKRMKKTSLILGFILSAVVLFFTGCTNGNDGVESTSQVANQEVNFAFFQVEVTPMSAQGAKMRGDGDTGAQSLSGTVFTKLDVVLYPVNENDKEKVISFNQNKADNTAEFGNVSMKVPAGDYTMVAVASKDGNVQFNSLQEVEFLNKVTDMAYICQKITVKQGSNNYNCSLQRAVAKLMFVNTGTRGNDVKNVTLHLSGNVSNKFNPTTGLAAGTNDITYTHTGINRLKATGENYIFYAFLSNEEEQKSISLTLDASDADGNVLKTLSFSDVSMKVNYCTTYKGDIFGLTSAASFTFGSGDFVDYGDAVTFDE